MHPIEHRESTDGENAHPHARIHKRIWRGLLGLGVAAGLLIAPRVAAEVQYHASGVYTDKTESFEPKWTETGSGLPMREPLSVVVEVDRQPFITDAAGFQIVSRPEGTIDPGEYPAEQLSIVLKEKTSAEQEGEPGVELHVGDSYLQSISINPGEIAWQDGWAASGTGPGEYVQAVDQRFQDAAANQELLAYIESLPEGSPIKLSVYLTPHNDLEAMVGAPKDSEQSVSLPSNSRELIRYTKALWGVWLGVDSYEKEKALRSVLDASPFGKQLTGNPDDMHPSLDDNRVLALQKLFADEIQRLRAQFPPLTIELDIIVFPSYYDTPEGAYSWPEVLTTMGKQLEADQDDKVQVSGIDLRAYALKYLELTDQEYDTLFQPDDQHYSNLGRAVVATALSWNRDGKELTENNLEEFKHELANFN